VLSAPEAISARSVGEWELRSQYTSENPFTDVTLDASFISPAGQEFTVPGFYDGDSTWRVRFNPSLAGQWAYRIFSRPANSDLDREGSFEVTPDRKRGFLRATPDRAWGFHYESDDPVFLLGDTVYNLFGMAYCGVDVESFLQRRAEQGFNLLRVRLPVSPFHPPEGYSDWQTRRTWPWGGSEQAPRFDRFNLEYFRTVDQVVRQAERLGLGLEMIMEAWGFEFPFNSRNIFVPEWEELWLRYLIARYDAFNSVYVWTPLNEYEYYPNGDWHYKPVADRWAMRIARWIKSVAQHGHVVSVHNGPVEPPFEERFAADPEAIDAIMFQEWGTRDEKHGWLAAGIEEQIVESLDGWRGSAVLAEYGYERNPELELLLPNHRYCDPEHTRRGAWRGAFCALGIIHGFENSWGPFQLLDKDQEGLAYLLHLHRFFTEIVPFHEMQPASHLIASGEAGSGRRPLALATANSDVVAVYLPVGGTVEVSLPDNSIYSAWWFDPRTGYITKAQPTINEATSTLTVHRERGEPSWDWVLVLSAADDL
jgi:Protein of unknown function (DUF4038)/Domain of unknown function (DUF5060)/Putative collagen-binding domain of a collagenase